MDDNRSSQRNRTFKGGSISWVGGIGVDCIIRNLSVTGALLELPHAAIVPDNFVLIIKPELLKRSCEVVRRSAQQIGVRFK